jgi:hypothetical protein
MEQYPIPQFIEQEGKIISFLSFRQFFYLIGAGVACFILYQILPRAIFYPLAVILFIVAGAIGFIKIEGMPLLDYVLSSFGFSFGGKNYTWKKKESPYPFKPIVRTQIKKIEQGPAIQAQISQLKKTKTSIELRTK